MIFVLFFLLDAADDDEMMVYAVLRSGPVPGWLLIASDSVCTLHTVSRPPIAMQCQSSENLWNCKE